MADNLLADGIKSASHLSAFDALAANRMDGMDISPVLINLIDMVPVSALPYLADQFDVLGIKGFKYCVTDEDRRELIKRAVDLHRYKGTPFAIKESLKVIGINDATLEEGVRTISYDGVYSYSGITSYGEISWARFRVKVNASDMSLVDSDLYKAVFALVNEYKNVRSHLVDITFVINILETVLASDNFLSNNPIQADMLGTGGTYYSGNSNYNGAYKYNKVNDELIINILS